MKYLLYLLLPLLAFQTACGKDDDSGNPDRTAPFTGEYVGDYTENGGGAAITFDNVPATVSRKNDVQVHVKMTVLGLANVEFDGMVTDSVTLTVPEFTLNGDKYAGTGQLTGDVLTFIVTKTEVSTGDGILYVGHRQ